MRQTSVVDDVMQAALELFAEQGYANTSVRQVVDTAGVTKGALYHYFQSKDDLLFAIYERILSVQTEHLEAIIAKGAPVAETCARSASTWSRHRSTSCSRAPCSSGASTCSPPPASSR